MREMVFATREIELLLRRTLIITPSNIDIWFGRWEGDDDLTQQQIRELREAGIDPETVETMDVFIRTTARQIWVPSVNGRTNYPWRRIKCPILGRRNDGRVKVIAPFGDRKLVWADGFLTKRRHAR